MEAEVYNWTLQLCKKKKGAILTGSTWNVFRSCHIILFNPYLKSQTAANTDIGLSSDFCSYQFLLPHFYLQQSKELCKKEITEGFLQFFY
jgi:hypothetical protein